MKKFSTETYEEALVTTKTIRVKNNINEWFDGDIAEKIVARDKLFKNF